MFKVIQKYNLANYQDQMWKLFDDLSSFLEKKFPNGEIKFESSERIVFTHTDLDYFLKDDFPGLTLYNLQLILKTLDIPNFTCAVISNMPNYKKYTRLVRNILRPDDIPMRAITMSTEIFVAKTLENNKQSKINNINFAFSVFSRLARTHRTFFMSKLFHYNLHNHGLVTYHNIDSKNDQHNQSLSSDSVIHGIEKTFPCNFLTTMPFTSHNNNIFISSPENKEILNNFIKDVPQYCNFIEENDVTKKDFAMKYQHDKIQDSLVYVGLETTAVYPTAFQSGISFKGISQKRPFIIFGAPGCISLLKNQGFKTFERWWDESYDHELDFEARVEKIINIIKELSLLTITDLRKIYKDMESILDYNYYHFVNNFANEELTKYYSELDKKFLGYNE